MLNNNDYISRGIEIYEIEPSEIIFDDSIRDYCKENKCGRYNKNFMCPPRIGTVEEYKEIIKSYNKGYILLIKDIINKPNINDHYNSQKKLHQIVLEVEEKLISNGYNKSLGFIAGECKLCSPCKLVEGYNECIHPNKARTSLEAVGVNVVETMKTKGIEIIFGTKNITWVGVVLMK
ncbi:DUF2284 domain-containing protein [Clostridium sp. D2Q-11]|uniref:DUF2284 domain-containing protein n=1 Tax=Anaeromonas frigoriresistens TaxID=2683708 RepID=A0A942Z8S7_9FIRM|nr:DUF2284 domain-containing protein [Anaeromonas frigoriresistens]MBS4540127.1 DUF2284 domain-containing protein [Anaeromonas frigoriresistens]